MKKLSHPRVAEIQSVVHARFDYDAASGELIWKVTRPEWIGRVAGSLKQDGYIRIQGRLVHRLVWVYFNGPVPNELTIDHIDGCRTNNRIENLRLATRSEQARNRQTNIDSHSGLKGAFYNRTYQGRKKYSAMIGVDGKQKFLGNFHTAEEATTAYAAAAKKYYGEFASTRPPRQVGREIRADKKLAS